MHGKHSRFVFIPLYRNTVWYYGIDSRKCATGITRNLQWIEMFFESKGWVKCGAWSYQSDLIVGATVGYEARVAGSQFR